MRTISIRSLSFIILALIIGIRVSYAQHGTINGSVVDAVTGDRLLFATCIDSLLIRGTVTNTNGFFSLTLPKGQVRLSFGYMGYQSQTHSFFLTSDTTLNIRLMPKPKELEEVAVVRNQSMVDQVVAGRQSVTVETIKATPSFIGQSDALRAITMLPGVSAGKEGHTHLYVRGGDRGQNLILLDGMRLYNTNHLGGLFSILNTDAIKQIDVYKGTVPARFGGRASSVIDVHTRDGNRNEHRGRVSLGVLTSGFLLEGPLGNKFSYLVASRTSYYNFINLLYPQDATGITTHTNKYSFVDVNAKIVWHVSPKASGFISIYTGHDFSKAIDETKAPNHTLRDESQADIHNTGFSVGYRTYLTPRLFLTNSVGTTRYSSMNNSDRTANNFGLIHNETQRSWSRIMDLSLQSRIEYYPNPSHTIRVGFEACHYIFTPISRESSTTLEIDTSSMSMGFPKPISSSDFSLYVEDEFRPISNVWLNMGIRASKYWVRDAAYYGVEPRASFTYRFISSTALRLSYVLMNQPNHLLVNRFSDIEAGYWMASTSAMPPQYAHQLSVGTFYESESLGVHLSVEVFGKRMGNLIEYLGSFQEDARTELEENIVLGGIGNAHGVETALAVNPPQGNWNGALSYTLSWSNRHFNDLNNGNSFPFIFDRRHDVSLLGSYRINRVTALNAFFTLASGSPITLPDGYVAGDEFFPPYYTYSGINNRRLPSYHRLDLSLVKRKRVGRRKNTVRQLEFNVYNVYARKNPVIIYYQEGKVYKKSLYSILPTVILSLEF